MHATWPLLYVTCSAEVRGQLSYYNVDSYIVLWLLYVFRGNKYSSFSIHRKCQNRRRLVDQMFRSQSVYVILRDFSVIFAILINYVSTLFVSKFISIFVDFVRDSSSWPYNLYFSIVHRIISIKCPLKVLPESTLNFQYFPKKMMGMLKLSRNNELKLLLTKSVNNQLIICYFVIYTDLITMNSKRTLYNWRLLFKV